MRMPTLELGSGIDSGARKSISDAVGANGATSSAPQHDFDSQGDNLEDDVSSAPAPSPSMFNLLGILNNYRMRIQSGTLDQLFTKINLDERSWNLLLRSQLPKNDLAMGLEQLLDTVTEFVKRLNRKSSKKVPTILDNVMYTEEVNFAYRVYSRSNTLFGQIFRYLKPLFAEMETYMESERGQLPSLNLKGMYADVRADLEEMYERQEQQALVEEQERREAEAAANASKANSKSGSKEGSKRGSLTAANPSISAPSSTDPKPVDSSSSSSTMKPPSASHSRRPSFASAGSTRAQKSRSSSRRGSLKEEARKKAAIAAALAVSAEKAAKREEELAAAGGSGGANGKSNTNSSTAQPSRQPSRRGSESVGSGVPAAGGDSSSIKIVVNSVSAGTSNGSSHRPSVHLAASPAITEEPSHISGDDTSAESTSAAALAAQALAAAAEAEAAAERVAAMEDPNDSEEDADLSSTAVGGPAGTEDIFSKLIASSSTHSYPLPPRLRRKAPPKPHPEFLQSYMHHHAKSFHMLESLLDCYLLCLLCALVALSLTETLQKKDLYALILSEVNTLASHFVRLGLPLADRLLSVDPLFLSQNLFALSFTQIEKGLAYSDARQAVRKARLLHAMFAALDIYVFPRAVSAHKHGCKCIATSHIVSPEESFVCTAGYDQALRIWDLKRNKCLAQFIGHTSIVTWCAFSANDTWIASASFDGTLKIWNARSGECLKTLSGHTDSILSADLGGKDKYIVSGGMDCGVRLWSTTTGKCLRIYTGHRHWVKAVRFASDDQSILSAGLDKRIFVWHLRSSGVTLGPRHTFLHADYILDLLVLSPARILSTSKDQTLRTWDLVTGKQEWELENPNGSTALTLGLSPDGSLIAAGFFDNTINVYDALKDCELKRQIKVHNDGILCVRWTDNRTLVVGTSTGNVQMLHI